MVMQDIQSTTPHILRILCTDLLVELFEQYLYQFEPLHRLWCTGSVSMRRRMERLVHRVDYPLYEHDPYDVNSADNYSPKVSFSFKYFTNLNRIKFDPYIGMKLPPTVPNNLTRLDMSMPWDDIEPAKFQSPHLIQHLVIRNAGIIEDLAPFNSLHTFQGQLYFDADVTLPPPLTNLTITKMDNDVERLELPSNLQTLMMGCDDKSQLLIIPANVINLHLLIRGQIELDLAYLPKTLSTLIVTFGQQDEPILIPVHLPPTLTKLRCMAYDTVDLICAYCPSGLLEIFHSVNISSSKDVVRLAAKLPLLQRLLIYFIIEDDDVDEFVGTERLIPLRSDGQYAPLDLCPLRNLRTLRFNFIVESERHFWEDHWYSMPQVIFPTALHTLLFHTSQQTIIEKRFFLSLPKRLSNLYLPSTLSYRIGNIKWLEDIPKTVCQLGIKFLDVSYYYINNINMLPSNLHTICVFPNHAEQVEVVPGETVTEIPACGNRTSSIALVPYDTLTNDWSWKNKL